MPTANPLHNATLDLLRGGAAQLVLWGHVASLLMIAPRLVPESQHLTFRILGVLTGYDHEAVMIFFVLSGYLVGRDTLLRVRSGTFSPSVYAANRLGRLYSVVVPGLIISAALDWTSFAHGAGMSVLQVNTHFWPPEWQDLRSLRPGTFLCNLAFLQGAACRQFGINSSLWSLSNEFFYYAMFPSALLSCWAASVRSRMLAALVLGFFLVVIAFSSSSIEPDRPTIYLVGFLIWILGACCGEFYAMVPLAATRRAGILLLGLAILLHKLRLNPWSMDIADALFTTWIIQYSVQPGSWLAYLPRAVRRAGGAFSNFSYSLYFMHLPLLFFAASFSTTLRTKHGYDVHGVLLLLAVIAVLNLSCWIFYWLFERHYHVVQRFLRDARPGRVAPA